LQHAHAHTAQAAAADQQLTINLPAFMQTIPPAFKIMVELLASVTNLKSRYSDATRSYELMLFQTMIESVLFPNSMAALPAPPRTTRRSPGVAIPIPTFPPDGFRASGATAPQPA
jgi:hypothetical protein